MNATNFYNMDDFWKNLNYKNRSLVLYLSSGIIASTDNYFYKSGATKDLFIKSSIHNDAQFNYNLVS